MNDKGVSLIVIVIASVVLLSGFTVFLRMQHSSQQISNRVRETVRAELLAAELLELFRALPTAEVLNYLRTNPVATSPGAATCSACGSNCPAGCPYFLCSHVNILDRQNGRLLNEDPIARLSPSMLDDVNPRRSPNRFYWVEVVDLTTLVANKTFCSRTADYLVAAGAPNYGLANNERLQVSVGLSWYPPGINEVKRVVLSTIIPRTSP